MGNQNTIAFYFKSKTALLDRLEALRPAVAKADKEAIAKHKKEEAAWMKKSRARIRQASAELLALSYDALKHAHTYDGFVLSTREDGQRSFVPRCPVRQEDVLNRAIALVGRLEERPLRVQQGGQYSFIHEALSLAVDQAGAVC